MPTKRPPSLSEEERDRRVEEKHQWWKDGLVTKFEITGLYRPPETIEAASEEEARREFHRKYPGFVGIIWSVEVGED